MRAAIILAAGKGTRLKSRLPKVLHPVAGRPMVMIAVDRARQAGLSPIVVVVGHQAEAVRAQVEGAFPGLCRFQLQSEQKGTGHAVQTGLMGLTDAPAGARVLILSGDVPLLEPDTLQALIGPGPKVRLLTTRLADPTGYGRVVRDPAGTVVRIVEDKDAGQEERTIREVNAGTYGFDLAFLQESVGQLNSDNAQGELYLTDVVEMAARLGQAEAVTVEDSVQVMGVNTRAELVEAERQLYLRVARHHLEQGVTVQDPASVRIDPEVRIGPDTVIEPRVIIRGGSELGRDCRVGTGSVLTDARLQDGAVVEPYTVVEGARMDSGSRAGPFARLRPGTELQAGARVGNFVELKKTVLGPGAKANHLAYLGDAHIGAQANLGAGTITCNYDGHGKHRTRVGEGSFVGSNATLVAPVDLGDHVYVAAGSTVTESVPAEALVFGRARQTTKPDRAAQVRAAAQARARAAAPPSTEDSEAKPPKPSSPVD